jgi:eukaryotic-like serine/threonine-protein kinase
MKKEKVSFWSFVFSKTFLKHLSLSGMTVLLAVIAILFYLKWYTHHDDTISLPDYSGVHIDSLEAVMKRDQLRYVIIDSIYNEKKEGGLVVDQDPKAGTAVKENRRIYLTTVAKRKKQVAVPHLIDLSLRRAIAKLKSVGLEVGELTYVPDMAKNAVLKQQVDGEDVTSADLFPSGTKVDLVLGNGLSDVQVELPLLEGLSYEEAALVLQMSSLNIGLAVFSPEVEDSSQAVVYRQRPEAREGRMINLGRNVDIFLRMPPDTSGL